MTIRIRGARPADAGAMARVHVDSWRTAYDGIVPADYLAGLSYASRESWWEQVLATERPGVMNFVAETGRGDIVGLAGAGPEREANPTYRAELYVIYLLAEYQRQGLGRRLFATVVQGLLRGGFNSLLVWVLKDNLGACLFYESVGGKQVGCKTITIGGADLVEVSYGWRDIGDLAAVRGSGECRSGGG